ncbi:MAG: 30S ribosomal protein S6 [bacterium]
MKEENKLYQIVCHINPLIDEKDLEELIKEIRKIITNNDGSILTDDTLNISKINRKRLSYPIGKHNESLYLNIDFSIDSQNISDIDHQFILNKNIIRHMITAKKKTNIASKKIIDYKATKKIESLSQVSQQEKNQQSEIETDKSKDSSKDTVINKKSEKAEKVKIDELDQKLEEILNA